MKKRYTISMLALALSAMLLLAGCSKSPDKTPSSSQTPPPSTSQSASPEGSTAEGGDTTEGGEATQLVNLLGQSDEAVKAALGEGSTTTDDAGAVIVREYEMEVFGQQTITTVAYENAAANMIISYAAENEFDAWATALSDELGAPHSESADNADGNGTKEHAWNLDGVIVSLKEAYDTLSLEIYPEA